MNSSRHVEITTGNDTTVGEKDETYVRLQPLGNSVLASRDLSTFDRSFPAAKQPGRNFQSARYLSTEMEDSNKDAPRTSASDNAKKTTDSTFSISKAKGSFDDNGSQSKSEDSSISTTDTTETENEEEAPERCSVRPSLAAVSILANRELSTIDRHFPLAKQPGRNSKSVRYLLAEVKGKRASEDSTTGTNDTTAGENEAEPLYQPSVRTPLIASSLLASRDLSTFDRNFPAAKQPGRNSKSVRYLSTEVKGKKGFDKTGNQPEVEDLTTRTNDTTGRESEEEMLDRRSLMQSFAADSTGSLLAERELSTVDRNFPMAKQPGRTYNSVRNVTPQLKDEDEDATSISASGNARRSSIFSSSRFLNNVFSSFRGKGEADNSKNTPTDEGPADSYKTIGTKKSYLTGQLKVLPGQKKKALLNLFALRNIMDLLSRIDSWGLFFIGCWSSALTAFVIYSTDEEWQENLNHSSRSVSIMGGFLSFALVFRTNVCYSRWWEARSAWGKLVYSTIHCAQQGRSWIADDHLASRFLVMNIVFAYASKALLRNNSLASEVEEGPSLVSAGIIQQGELDAINSQSGWQPYYCIDVLREIINVAWSRENCCNIKDKGAREAAYKALEDTFRDLALSIGPCIKVKATGLPVSYNTLMNTLVFIFFTGASLAWSPLQVGLGWYTPIVVCVMFCLMQLIIAIGDSMQTPFGSSFAGLPLQKLCVVIEQQVGAVEKRHMARGVLITGDYSDSASRIGQSKQENFAGIMTDQSWRLNQQKHGKSLRSLVQEKPRGLSEVQYGDTLETERSLSKDSLLGTHVQEEPPSKAFSDQETSLLIGEDVA